MENAVDALKMAAAILVFIIAIASSFSLFGKAKVTADSIITMRDKQAYLEAAELDNGILYTSSSAIQGDTTGKTEEEIEAQKIEKSSIIGVTKGGDRIVKVEDIVSTIFRYSTEKYGVTIIKSNGTVIARFDSSTEATMSEWHIFESSKKSEIAAKIAKNISNNYVPKTSLHTSDPNEGDYEELENLYSIELIGETIDRGIKCGAPWYGRDEQIHKRIICDLTGGEPYIYSGQKYVGKGLLNEFKNANYIVEVTNEVDKSTYLKDKDESGKEFNTDLLQQFEMPTIEIVYILY